jgi:hypothetical protein
MFITKKGRGEDTGKLHNHLHWRHHPFEQSFSKCSRTCCLQHSVSKREACVSVMLGDRQQLLLPANHFWSMVSIRKSVRQKCPWGPHWGHQAQSRREDAGEKDSAQQFQVWLQGERGKHLCSVAQDPLVIHIDLYSPTRASFPPEPHPNPQVPY